ncbi:MAG: hypothetical protein MUF18_19070 [Fimbriiglobus sp.]|jgi:hypothetical protein|nr:hypothetical protein [Fimbriiglobus sp.]
MPSRPSLARLVRLAAELRAAGNAWEKIAADVDRPVKVVREWPRRFPAQWRRAFAIHERRMLAEATSEAVVVLRQQLRSKDEKTAREAGVKLVQVRTMLEKARGPKAEKPKSKSSPPGSADRLLAILRGMTDEELRQAALEELGG